MIIGYHAEFGPDIRRFEEQYRKVSQILAERFRKEIGEAIERVKSSPGSAGHFVNTGSKVLPIRRLNLRRFPFFLVPALNRKGCSSAPLFQVDRTR
jgi:hypothetical protein